MPFGRILAHVAIRKLQHEGNQRILVRVAQTQIAQLVDGKSLSESPPPTTP